MNTQLAPIDEFEDDQVSSSGSDDALGEMEDIELGHKQPVQQEHRRIRERKAPAVAPVAVASQKPKRRRRRPEPEVVKQHIEEVREGTSHERQEIDLASLNLKALRISSGLTVMGLLVSAGLAFGALVVVQPMSLVMLAWFIVEIVAVVSCVCFFMFNHNAFQAVELPQLSAGPGGKVDPALITQRLAKQESRCKRSVIAMLLLMEAEIIVGLETLNVIVFNLADISSSSSGIADGQCPIAPDGVFTSWSKLPQASQALFICICIVYSFTVIAQAISTAAAYRLHLYYAKQLHRSSASSVVYVAVNTQAPVVITSVD